MADLTRRLDNLEKKRQLIERPAREWETAELCRLLAKSTPEQLRECVSDQAELDVLTEEIRKVVPDYAQP